jgi:hypothetical protein
VFQSWNDSGAASHIITVGNTGATYQASFVTQYLLTTSASPAAGGTLFPAGANFYSAGSTIAVQATANPNYTFANFSSGLSSSQTPQNLTLNGPATVVANFTPLQPNLAVKFGAMTIGAGANVSTSLTFTNTGLGAAANATITGVTASTLAGTGSVSLASTLPLDVGTISSKSSASTTLNFNWPATATRVGFAVTYTADGDYSGSGTVTAIR